MEYVYPAIFNQNSDGSYTIMYPDLPGCISEGKSLSNALYMAKDALTQWLSYLTENGEEIPFATDIVLVNKKHKDSIVTLISADLKDYRAVKRTISLPKWMDEKASAAGLSLSRVLQDALKKRIE